MANKCFICTHVKRLEIDREIVKGGNLAKIARFYGVEYYSLQNHAKEHVSRQLSQAWQKKELEESFNLLSKVDEIITKAEQIFDRNFKDKKDGIALKALDSQRNTIQLLANISYALHQAKLTELEIMKHKSGETDQQQEAYFQDKLQVLTIEELKVFQKLVDKINNQTQEVIIPPKTVRRRRRAKTHPVNTNTPPNKVQLEETQENSFEDGITGDVNNDLIVRPIESPRTNKDTTRTVRILR